MDNLIKKIKSKIDRLVDSGGNHSVQIKNLTAALVNLEEILNNNFRCVRTEVLNLLDNVLDDMMDTGEKKHYGKIYDIQSKIAAKI